MPIIHTLSPHVANLIAAGEVVERPASAAKELLENAVDAGATKITVEIRNGGMTFLRITDNGCGMSPEDAETAFLRHATSKLRTAEDLTAISTMGFRGEALAAIASVSRVDLLTKTPGAVAGTSLHLEAGKVTEKEEAGCPEGTTIIVRDLFYNTPARMKFMKADTVEGSAVTAVVQKQALAHPEVAYRLLREGKEVLNVPGDGKLRTAIYGVYGREAGNLIPVDSHWEKARVWGYVSRPTDSRNSRNFQTFFVSDRPVKSKLLTAALEEAYRNQIMVGKFPACVLHIDLPANAVDVNVHPAKTEVKFLSERQVFDCVHYGVLAALRKITDRPELDLGKAPEKTEASPAKKPDFYRTMTTEEYKKFAQAMEDMPKPDSKKIEPVLRAWNTETPGASAPLRQTPAYPQAAAPKMPPPPSMPRRESPLGDLDPGKVRPLADFSAPPPAADPVKPEVPVFQTGLDLPQEKAPLEPVPEVPAQEQETIPLAEPRPWRMAGELFHTYILVEQGEEAYLIDKHAAHERILFDKLRSQEREIAGQQLLTPVVCPLGAEAAATVLSNLDLLSELGYEAQEFGEGTVILRQIPMDLDPEQAKDSITQLAEDLMEGRREDRDTLRDNLLHTIACKAAIKGGWHTDPKELEALVNTVMSREDLKYCPHGRPICVKLTRRQLEHRFGRG